MSDLRRAAAVYAPESRAQAAAALVSLSETEDAALSVVGVFSDCGGENAERVEELYRYSSSVGASMTALYSEEPALALLDYVKHNRITDLMISEKDTSGAARLIAGVLPKVNVTVMPADRGSVLHLAGVDLLCCALRRQSV